MSQDQRVEDLEVKIAFLEKSIAELDDVVRGLADQLSVTQMHLDQLVEHVREGGAGLTGFDHEKPPHYSE